MAIDDNETYGLTGAQVKDLANKVKGKPDALVVYIDKKLANNINVKAYSDAALTTAIESGQIYTAFNAGRPVVLFWQSTIQFTPDWTYSIVSADSLAVGVDLYAAYSNTTYSLSSGSLTSNLFSCHTEVLATTSQLTNGSVTKVGTGTVGGTATPIYLSSGTPTAVNKPASGSWFKGVPDISSGGVMEVGKYIDFHNANTDTSDYAVRLQTQGNNQVAVNLPTSAGTLALTSQILGGRVINNSYNTPSSWGEKSLDISSIPTNALFAVYIIGYVKPTNNFAVSSWTATQSGLDTWVDSPNSSASIANLNVYTKKSGEDTLKVRLGFGQPNEMQIRVLVVRVA